MSLELLLDTLEGFGLKRRSAQVYAFLARKGPQGGKDLTKALNMTKQQLYPSLKDLQRRGIVISSNERPALFSAAPIEQVLDKFVKARIEEVQRLIRNREELLSRWRAMTPNNLEP